MFYKKNKTNKKLLIFLTLIIIFFVFYKKYFSVVRTENVITNETKEVKMPIKKNENIQTDLPSWNLTDLYSNINDSNIDSDLSKLTKMVESFQSYKGKLRFLDRNNFFIAITEYEEILKIIAKLSSYSYLKYSENLSNDDNIKFYQKINEKITNISSNLVFFPLELNNLSNEKINSFYRDSNIAKYKQVIENNRLFKPYQLDENLEKLFIDKSITSRDAFIRLYDETLNNMQFVYNGKTYNQAEISELMNYSKDEKIRKDTSKIFSKTLEKQANLFAFITNTLAKDKEISDKWRKFKKPISSRNISNNIDDEVIETLVDTVKKNYKNTSHRYYKWKAKELGKEKLHYYDRNAPLPYDNTRTYTWEEAKKIVLSAYNDFSPRMANIGKDFFDKNWIDVPTRQGKMNGGYMMPTIPEVHPYILLNFQGKYRDVTTLAHELGHGIHQVLSDKNGFLNSRTPLTLAETASVFGEQLTFRKILKNETNKQKQKAILANKIEDMINTVIRQIAFLDFEIKVHNERKHGELSLERINQIWFEVQYESLGKSNFIFDDEYKNYWMYISHFIHSPFYVYAYAFGDCLVNTLYSIYQSNPNGFEDKYINLLKAGGSKNYTELLAEFDLNPKSPDFWQKGLNELIKMIDELENI